VGEASIEGHESVRARADQVRLERERDQRRVERVRRLSGHGERATLDLVQEQDRGQAGMTLWTTPQGEALVAVSVEVDAHVVSPHPREPPLHSAGPGFPEASGEREDGELRQGARPRLEVEPERGLVGPANSLRAEGEDGTADPPEESRRQRAIHHLDEPLRARA
jgi:hypothetical protein